MDKPAKAVQKKVVMSGVVSRLFVIVLFIAYVALLLGITWWALASYFKVQYQKWQRRRKSMVKSVRPQHTDAKARN